jgi:hypothetical protein
MSMIKYFFMIHTESKTKPAYKYLPGTDVNFTLSTSIYFHAQKEFNIMMHMLYTITGMK